MDAFFALAAVLLATALVWCMILQPVIVLVWLTSVGVSGGLLIGVVLGFEDDRR